MRIRGLLIAALALAALSGGVWWSNKAAKEKEGKPAADAAPKILEVAEDLFRQVEIRKGEEATVLRKADDGKWQLTMPKPLQVDQDAARSLVSSLSSMSSDRLVEEKAADLATFGLEKPTLAVLLTRKDGKTQKLLVGDETPTGGGFFAKLDGDARVFTVASYVKSNLDKTYKDFQDKRLLTFDSDKLIRVELAAKNQSMEFGKNNQNEWQLLKPKPLRADGGHVEELIRKLRDAKMDTAVSDEDAKKFAKEFAGAAVVATAKTTDAMGTQQLEVRQAKDKAKDAKDTDKTYYAKSSAVEGIHKVGSDLGDGLNKGLDDFRNKKLFDFGFSDPAKIEIRDGSKTAAYQKTADKWMSGNKQMDSPGIQALVDKLRDLSSIKFLDSGFTTAFFEATVTSGDGKRVEKVQIAKSGNSYQARRENEPAIYELDGKAVEELQKAASEVKEHQPPKDEKKKK